MESFLEPELITHAVHVRVDRETGVVRVLRVAAAHDSGTILNPIGADGQVRGGVVMGIGQALSEGMQLDSDGRQRNPHLLDYKLVTAADAPPIEIDWVQTPAQDGGPNGSKGIGEPPCVPTPGAIANAIAKVIGRRVQRLPMTPERVWEATAVTASLTVAATLDEATQALGDGARIVAGGTDLVVGARQGKAPLPENLVAIHRLDELRRIDSDETLTLGALVTHAEIVGNQAIREKLTALADACAIVGSHATRVVGTIGGNLMNASPAMESGGPLLCFDARITLRSATGTRELGVDELLDGPGRTTASPDELLEAVRIPLPPAGTGSCYARLEYRRQMEIAVVGVTAVITLEGGSVTHARVAITALAPTIRRVPDAEAGPAWSGLGRRGRRRAIAAASKPISDVRASADYRSAMAAVIGRRAIEVALARARNEHVPDSGQPGPPRRRAMKVAANLTVNGVEYPVELEPHLSLLRAVREHVGLTGAKEGCDDSECGACMMLLDGQPVNSCSYLALQAVGREITTVEGLAPPGELSDLQRAFLEHGGVQCGFCTPGMLISATALLGRSPAPSEDEVRTALAGNLCRCTGYEGIVEAVLATADGAR